MACFDRRSFSISLVLTVVCGFSLVSSSSQFQRLHHPAKSDGSLSFLVIGDWGRHGLYNQSEVAFQMGRIGKELDIDFVMSTGDNFYDSGLKGVNDPAFRESFSKIYTDKSLQKPWYSVLGNHDYRGNAKAQLNSRLRSIDPRWFCFRSFILNTGIAEFFFVDTTPFVDNYFTDPDGQIYDWRGIQHRPSYLCSLLKELDMAIKRSTAKWKIVVGHHTIRSIGHHGDTPELIERLLPILKDNDVDFYINGHDHCLERISCVDSRMEFLTSGAGSKAWRGGERRANQCAVHFFYDGQGFMSVQLNSTGAFMAFYDVFGRPRHRWNYVPRHLHFEM
ncbi:purple acid phosphatase 17-like [Diospyros lotus]|uniref:purple acid phosphatase 17-like n=1 Tax=Diospyros lotus TaxID=55363 RepID=UPI0022596BC3|nr:purple acid phosphatase 17-like [Diospyros lotus]